jgi:L-lactate dehydrogenase
VRTSQSIETLGGITFGRAEPGERRRESTNYAIGLAAARIVEAVFYDEHQVLAVSFLLTGFAGISDVCLSVPSVVNRTGVLKVLPVPRSEDKRAGMHHSARTVRAVIDSLEL